MANRDVFSKVLPNIKLSTVLDSEGREIQVNVSNFIVRFLSIEVHAQKI